MYSHRIDCTPHSIESISMSNFQYSTLIMSHVRSGAKHARFSSINCFWIDIFSYIKLLIFNDHIINFKIFNNNTITQKTNMSGENPMNNTPQIVSFDNFPRAIFPLGFSTMKIWYGKILLAYRCTCVCVPTQRSGQGRGRHGVHQQSCAIGTVKRALFLDPKISFTFQILVGVLTAILV